MNPVFETLHQQFYSIPQNTVQAKRIEANYQILKQHLSREDLNRVMHIMDDKDLLVTKTSLESFIQGFKVAWTLVHEMNVYGEDFVDEESREESEEI